jgi:hypothetical protein
MLSQKGTHSWQQINTWRAVLEDTLKLLQKTELIKQ